jgi:ABC-type lipoprotein export system ATPase subunit
MKIAMSSTQIQRRAGGPRLHYPEWTLASGAQVLVTGPSGSGKTTLIHLLAGLLQPDRGCIRLGGTELGALRESARDRFRGMHIGLVFQSLHLVGRLSAFDNLLLGAYASGNREALRPDSAFRQRATSLLERLGVGELAQRRTDSLSRGQAQRVALARALVHQPGLILADEPTSALDDRACQQIADTLREEAEANRATLLVSSHDQRLHARFAMHYRVGAEP